MQSQSNSQGPPLPVSVQTNLSQPGQHSPQNFTNNIASAGMQGTAGLSSSLPPVSSSSQTNVPNVNQNSNMQSRPNISGMMQSSPPSNLQQNQQSSAQQSPQSGVQQHLQSVRQLQTSNIHQQQKAFQQPQQQQHLMVQSSATNIQQNQLIGGAQSGTSIMQHSKVTLQQSHQSVSVSPSQVQQSQQQMMSNLLPKGPNQTQTQQQSQMMSQMQLQPVQLQQQLGLQQQPNPLHRDMQQRLQTLQQQKQVFQPQRAMPEASSSDAFEDAGSILVNISRSDAGRKLLLEPERGLIKEILKEFDSASPVRRKGVSGTIRNCCFGLEAEHQLENLLTASEFLWPTLLLPIAGKKAYSEEETSKMPLALGSTLLVERKVAYDPETQIEALEAIYLIALQERGLRALRLVNGELILEVGAACERNPEVMEAYERVGSLLLQGRTLRIHPPRSEK